MDNREEITPVQPENGKRYAIDELLALMEPQHQEDLNTTRRCIAGLTEYAAQLAAKHQEAQVPQLRKFCIDMAEFWGLAEDDTWDGFRKMEDQYSGAFDNAVSAARDSGHVPELSERTRQDILDGLELYAQEMVSCGDLEKLISECNMLAAQLRTQWKMKASPSPPTAPETDKPDCALVGEDGNIFNLSGIAARTLRENGLQERADELLNRIFAGECDSYEGALRVISAYVNITGPEEHSIQMGGL